MRSGAWLLVLSVGCGPVLPEREPHERHDSLAEARQGQSSGARPTSPQAVPPSFSADEQVESVVSPEGRFRVHFSRGGPNAVPPGDADGNGVPDAVEVVGRTYDQVARFYEGLGFLTPGDDASVGADNGGDGLFDVYLVDFAGRADGAFRLDACVGEGQRCVGHMLQENDFAGYNYPSYEKAVRILASHEFFHAVQAAYRPGLGSVASEGSAVWASERFDASLDDLEHFSSAYLKWTDRSLVQDPPGPAASFSYGAGLYFQYLGERFGDAALLSLWRDSLTSPTASWPVLVDAFLRREGSLDFDTAFVEFSRWNLSTGARARPGDGYARGGGYDGLAPSPRTLPSQEADVRLTTASARYFQVPGGSAEVLAAYEPRAGEDASRLHLLVAAVTDTQVLRVSRADGPGALSAKVAAADATHVVVALVDGRHEGVGRYGALCLTAEASGAPCVGSTPEPETPPSDAGGCGAAPGGTGGAAWLFGLLLVARWASRTWVGGGVSSV
ncbi:hypothetical protein MYSTI_07230 [Myxococcus stipitatus DSM 14675]|uniref:Uncharacterized protein n=1 Tax=Myxococcus stipitatus (strain DSM 14675 / JCM 12634 / Mx s8) TaxID=1278073 RepID=L7ULT2_MYXSD|nr:MXAN_6640 family putative metalloprotease [Myxococcus stipitatus]AGC48502.1 hypothetical protein MYSTI_07230 [Myxococcus stipitatus DSM 14675]